MIYQENGQMKILFFDFWLKGVANFERLVPELNSRGVSDIKMLHVASWESRQDKAVHHHKGFDSYDISYYKTNNLYKVLEKEKPDVLIMLNLFSFVDKALVVFCKLLGIKSVYLSHGILFMPNESYKEEQIQINRNFKKNIFKNIKKSILLGQYNYFLSTLKSNKTGRYFSSILGKFRNPASMGIRSTYTDEMDADEIIVYYDADKRMLLEKRNFPDHNISVVGNPELDIFVKTPIVERGLFMTNNNMPDGEYLLYLEDGFVQNGMMDRDEWCRLVTELNDICRKNNLYLVIKLHPRTEVNDFADFFEKRGIIYFKNIDFKNIIHHSKAVTSLLSTTITFALICGKRVVSPRWGSFENLRFHYPDNVIHYSYTKDDFESFLMSDKESMKNASYIRENIGMVDGKAISRIVDLILKK